jgi:hypothetical protein
MPKRYAVAVELTPAVKAVALRTIAACEAGEAIFREKHDI